MSDQDVNNNNTAASGAIENPQAPLEGRTTDPAAAVTESDTGNVPDVNQANEPLPPGFFGDIGSDNNGGGSFDAPAAPGTDVQSYDSDAGNPEPESLRVLREKFDAHNIIDGSALITCLQELFGVGGRV